MSSFKSNAKNFLWVLGFLCVIVGLLVWSITYNVAQVAEHFVPRDAKIFTNKGAVAVMYIEDMIVFSDKTIEVIEEISENSSIKAVVVRISSPGGAVAPSQEIYHALKRLDATKPVVCSMGDLAASGGYYIALGCRHIVASEGTLTGSIGVIMNLMNTEKLYEWAKLKPLVMKAGKNKDLGSPFREMTESEKSLLQSMLDDTHRQFKDAVLLERSKTLKKEIVEEYADGRILIGSKAKELGFVDEVGGEFEAINAAKKFAGLKDDAEVTRQKTKQPSFRDFMGGSTKIPSSSQEALALFAKFISGATNTHSQTSQIKSGVPYYLSPAHIQ